MAAAFSSPVRESTKALTQPRNCVSLRLRNLVICTSFGDMLAQGGLDLLRVQLFPAVQASQNPFDDLLGLVLAIIFQEAVVKMFSDQGVVDLRFFVVILQFRKIYHAILARILGLPVNLEHDLIGLKSHSYEV